MYPFSFDLTRGFVFFADAAATEEDVKLRRCFNTACIVFAAGVIEAVINERISLEAKFFDSEGKRPFYEALAAAQRSISLKDKWNLLVSVRGGYYWDSSKEPYQSYDMILTLRNELLHYKADFLGHLEPPVNRIRPLLERFAVPCERADDSNVQWLHVLLETRELGKWVTDKVRYDALLSLGSRSGE
jgi:hypothetical protein